MLTDNRSFTSSTCQHVHAAMLGTPRCRPGMALATGTALKDEVNMHEEDKLHT